MRLPVLIGLTVLLPAIAAAQTTPEKCATLAPGMQNATGGVATMVRAMSMLNYDALSRGFSGAEAEHFRKLGERQAELLPLLQDYLTELDAATQAMLACAG
ncbi:hypothetical protein [Gemmobacter caeruleus]|uniref:hypothetical protein n=1 Tax=Gemmobacter caeruleus TaxID=2595004 RepID=UPI0011F082A6|nr:hypothetical protein [Gemmobacter caeruleus]